MPRRLGITDQQSAYLDWLLDPERKGSKNEWSEVNHVSIKTIQTWKMQPMFRDEWDRRARKLNLGPERVQSVIDSIHKKAVSGDINAARLYLTYVEKLTPPAKVKSISADFENLTDEEVARMVENANVLRGTG